MEKQPYDIELLDKYLEGNLTSTELEEIESHFDTQEELDFEIKVHQAIVEGIRTRENRSVISKLMPEVEQKMATEGLFDTAQKQEGIKHILSEIEKELDEEGYFEKVKKEHLPVKGTVLFMPTWAKRAASIAAMLLLIPVAIGIYSSIKEQLQLNRAWANTLQIEQQNANSFGQSIRTDEYGASGIIPAQMAILKQGMLAFHASNFVEAEQRLDEFYKNHPKEEIAAYYLALCYMKQEKYHEARLLLTKGVYKQYKDSVLWFKTLCLFKLGEKANGMELLKEVEQGNSVYAKKAQELQDWY